MDIHASYFKDDVLAKLYADYRHSYSDELFKTITDYCRETLPALNLAVDVGCGPGNSTVGFTKYFKKVIGVDISEEQISYAPRDIPNCEFRVALAQDLAFLEDNSVDLFASGLAFYLMPQEETFAEADRVLRPGGTIAIFGYGIPKCKDPLMSDFMRQAFMTAAARLPENISDLANLWRDSERIPYPGWRRQEGPVVRKLLNWDGIMSLWMPLQKMLNKIGSGDEADGRYTKELAKLAAEKLPNLDPDEEFEMLYDTYITLGRKPVK